MPQNDISALLAQVAPLSDRKNEIDAQIRELKSDYDAQLRELVNEQRQVDDDIKKLITHVNALLGVKSNTTMVVSPVTRGRRRGRNAMHNSMTLQSAITKVLENRAYWGAEQANVPGLKTREIAEAITNAQLWSPSNSSLFQSQVSQTISRMKKEGLVHQENDRRYALIED